MPAPVLLCNVLCGHEPRHTAWQSYTTKAQQVFSGWLQKT